MLLKKHILQPYDKYRRSAAVHAWDQSAPDFHFPFRNIVADWRTARVESGKVNCLNDYNGVSAERSLVCYSSCDHASGRRVESADRRGRPRRSRDLQDT